MDMGFDKKNVKVVLQKHCYEQEKALENLFSI